MGSMVHTWYNTITLPHFRTYQSEHVMYLYKRTYVHTEKHINGGKIYVLYVHEGTTKQRKVTMYSPHTRVRPFFSRI